MIDALLGIFVITTAVFIYTTIVNVRKVNFYERWITSVTSDIKNVLDQMKAIDATGHFESDDEVGIVFNLLQETLNSLSIYGRITDAETKKAG